MDKLIKSFSLAGYQVISVIGSGGKSNLINYLAKSWRDERILIGTTTKILYPQKGTYDYIYNDSYHNLGNDGAGITVAGDIVKEVPPKKITPANTTESKCCCQDAGIFVMKCLCKLQMPNDKYFRKAFNKFNKIVLEADGSMGLPLKAWADYEPVILPETTITIGVIPITSVGLKANPSNIHRFPLWLELTEENPDVIISIEALIRTITHKKGMWQKAAGERILCINQVENSNQLNVAKDIVKCLPIAFKKNLRKIIACSVKNEQGYVLWDNASAK